MLTRLIAFLFGMFFGYVMAQLYGPQRQQPAEARVWQPEPVRAPGRPAEQSDPLTEINGIGPAFEQALNAIGIFTFAQLARQDADTLADRLAGMRVTAERIVRDQWIEQARERAAAGTSD